MKIGLGLLLMLGSSLAACASREPEVSGTSIVGGSAVRANETVAHSTVALVTMDGELVCSGSLITDRHILTAAHCLETLSFDELRVVFGTNSAAGTMRSLSDGWQHEEFAPSLLAAGEPDRAPNDIGIVELDEGAPDGFAPVKLLEENGKLTTGDEVILAGFGLRDGGGAESRESRNAAGKLFKVATKVTKISKAAQEWSYGGTLGKSACRGDSGGPAFVKRGGALRLIGVTSRGDPACLTRGTYVDVRRYWGWLRNTGALE